MKPFGNNNNFKTMFDSEGNMHMISGEGDIKYDSFTGRFFDDTGSGSLKQDPVTGDMWFDKENKKLYMRFKGYSITEDEYSNGKREDSGAMIDRDLTWLDILYQCPVTLIFFNISPTISSFFNFIIIECLALQNQLFAEQ